jgi:hypothetical protein
MQFFSGFSLANEAELFREYIDTSAYNVCGFSYGAIKAFQQTQEFIIQGKRVDRLQLFSPAFFQTKSEKFKRLQLLAYSKNEQQYLEQFREACFSPYKKQNISSSITTKEQLEELLSFEWSINELLALEKKGVVIEVYLGAKDMIIDPQGAREFFVQCSCVSYIKDANHFLQTNEGKK